MIMSYANRNKMSALLKKREVLFPRGPLSGNKMLKSQLSLKRNDSGSILGRVESLFVLKQSGLTKNKKKEVRYHERET